LREMVKSCCPRSKDQLLAALVIDRFLERFEIEISTNQIIFVEQEEHGILFPFPYLRTIYNFTMS